MVSPDIMAVFLEWPDTRCLVGRTKHTGMREGQLLARLRRIRVLLGVKQTLSMGAFYVRFTPESRHIVD